MDSQQTLTKCHANTQTSLTKKEKKPLHFQSKRTRTHKNRKKRSKRVTPPPKGANKRVKLRKWTWGGILELLPCP